MCSVLLGPFCTQIAAICSVLSVVHDPKGWPTMTKTVHFWSSTSSLFQDCCLPYLFLQRTNYFLLCQNLHKKKISHWNFAVHFCLVTQSSLSREYTKKRSIIAMLHLNMSVYNLLSTLLILSVGNNKEYSI